MEQPDIVDTLLPIVFRAGQRHFLRQKRLRVKWAERFHRDTLPELHAAPLRTHFLLARSGAFWHRQSGAASGGA